MGSIKAVRFGATNSWGLKFRRRGQNEDIRYFGSIWLCTRCRLFSRTNWKWVGRDSRWIWSRETSRVGCITKITGNDNCSYKINWNKDATSTEFLLFQRRIEIRLWWELAFLRRQFIEPAEGGKGTEIYWRFRFKDKFINELFFWKWIML